MFRNPVDAIRRIGIDLRWAVRMLSHHRGFAVLAALPLILGVAAQIAVSFMLLTGCGLLMRSEWKAQRADVGLDTEHTADVYVDFAANGYDEVRAREAISRLRDRARTAAGVVGVAVAARPPLSNSFLAQVARDPAARPVLAGYNLVDADFLPTLRIPIVRGHNVAAQSAGGVVEVVISASLANALWPSTNALGRRIDLRLVTSPGLPAGRDARMTAVVGGVAQDTQRAKLSLDSTARYVYVRLQAGWPQLQTSLMVRTVDPGAAAWILEKDLRGLNLATAVAPRRLSDVLQERRRPVAVAAVLAAGFGGLALLIAVVGLTGW